jgi:hypothetical protein
MLEGKNVEITNYKKGFERFRRYHNEWFVVRIDKKHDAILLKNTINSNIYIYDIHEWRLSLINNEC